MKKGDDDDDVDVFDDMLIDIDDFFDFVQFVRIYGYWIDYMIKKCRWKFQLCGLENFIVVIIEFGFCYMFNLGGKVEIQ